MRYMGWSYDQLMACPFDYLEVIFQVAKEEEIQKRNNR